MIDVIVTLLSLSRSLEFISTINACSVQLQVWSIVILKSMFGCQSATLKTAALHESQET